MGTDAVAFFSPQYFPRALCTALEAEKERKKKKTGGV